MCVKSKFQVMPGRRDELREQALYAFFDGIRGDRARMVEAIRLDSCLSYRAPLVCVSDAQDRSESPVPHPSGGSSA